MRFCELKQIVQTFFNPYSPSLCACDFQFETESSQLICKKCRGKVCVQNNVIQFVTNDVLDPEKKRELQGNTFDLTQENIDYRVRKEHRSRYYSHFSNLRLGILIEDLRRINRWLDFENLVFLGCGYGYEIAQLLKRGLKVKRIFASDLSLSNVSLISRILSQYDVDLVLFTSDLDHCPVQEKTYPIVIFEALHHTPDMHLTIERLLSFGYERLFFAEPTNNKIIRWLAKRGLAQRVEYSGLKPGRLEIAKVRRLCDRYNYALTVHTTWDFPEDYFRKVVKKSGITENIFVHSIDVLSYLTNAIHCGNMSNCYLRRKKR